MYINKIGDEIKFTAEKDYPTDSLYLLNICLMAAMGEYSIIRGPAQRITSRIFSRIAGL
jgi:hypothetical protein